MIFQTIIIGFMAFWMYQEYLNNLYLQAYVNNSLQGSGLFVVALGSVGAFTSVAVGLYVKLRHTRRALEHSLTVVDGKTENGRSGSILEPHVEQHLIEMIRKTTPATSSATPGMPMLKREGSPSNSQTK